MPGVTVGHEYGMKHRLAGCRQKDKDKQQLHEGTDGPAKGRAPCWCRCLPEASRIVRNILPFGEEPEQAGDKCKGNYTRQNFWQAVDIMVHGVPRLIAAGTG